MSIDHWAKDDAEIQEHDEQWKDAEIACLKAEVERLQQKYEAKGPVSGLSVADLHDYIRQLQAEVERLRGVNTKRSAELAQVYADFEKSLAENECLQADARLGAMVRRMPLRMILGQYDPGRWFSSSGVGKDTHGETPEEALEKAGIKGDGEC